VSGVAADEIRPMPLCPPRAADSAGIASAVLIGLVLALLAGVVLADPHTAGSWLTQASNRREVQAHLGLLPVRGIFLPWLIDAVRT
jgi:uncharacterized membrane protein